MPDGTHWEWRGFGRISERFEEAFGRYALKFANAPWDETQDEYIWIESCPVNVKLRSGGTQQGLKLKRLVRKDGDLELWREDPRELYPFDTVNAEVVGALAASLGLSFRTIPSGRLAARQILDLFRSATPPAVIVAVHKRRQTRLVGPAVQVELAEITRVTADDAEVSLPRPFFSVAAENNRDLTGAPAEAVAAAREEVVTVLGPLGLLEEPLKKTNYLDMIAVWMAGRHG